jgi:hypothetical protein
MFNKILKKYSRIVGCILTGIVMMSVGTISTFGSYEHQMPKHLVPDDE